MLSAMAQILSPESWRKYVSFITGLVVISCIISPVENLARTKAFSFGFSDNATDIRGAVSQQELINKELSDRISADIEERLLSEFNLDITASVELKLNSGEQIEGVEKIRIKGAELNRKAIERLEDVYGTDKIYCDQR